MNLKDKKRRIRINKLKKSFEHFLNYISIHKQYLICFVLIIACLIIAYVFYIMSNSKENIYELLFSIFISSFTSLLTGLVIYLFLNWNNKEIKKNIRLLSYIIKIDNKVYELLKIIDLIIFNKTKTKGSYNIYCNKIGTWFVDFNYLKVAMFVNNKGKSYLKFDKIIKTGLNNLEKQYSSVVDYKSLLDFCRCNRESIISWMTDISKYKVLLQDKLDIADNSNFVS